MPTLNQIGSGLSGITGSGQFAGSTGPTITLTKVSNTNIGTGGNSFTCNGVCGQLTTGTLSIPTVTSISYTWNNSFIVSDSLVIISGWQQTSGTVVQLIASAVATGAGTATLRIYNGQSGTTFTSSILLNYIVF